MSLKIFNDPVHGFVEVPRGLLLGLLDHPWFQRLRRIRQMGFSSLVYPGAVHTRFSHALGAMHLTNEALHVLARKGAEISPEEHEATLAAILLHDLGHGPFSHSLENTLIPGLHHETMTQLLMRRMNTELGGKLTLALEIFTGNYPRPFLHQLISSQLDMDRMDYLIRDSFFTGVHEGIVGTDRIIKTLAVRDERLVVEEKGIYSVEKFIVARRLMYWQVYLHKTALGAEKTLIKLLERAREIALAGAALNVDENLDFFLNIKDFQGVQEDSLVNRFTELGDEDILMALKQWKRHPDPVLSDLSQRLLERRLLKLRFSRTPFDPEWVEQLRERFILELELKNREEIDYYVFQGEVSNLPYYRSIGPGAPEETEQDGARIEILLKDGSLRDIAEAADMSNIAALSERLTKYYLCTPAY